MPDPMPLLHISKAAVPRAIKRAEHYRLLNHPEQAESICLDVLDVDPTNQEAIVVLILALTDQFGSDERSLTGRPASAYLAELTDEYQRSYYGGIIHERQARAYLGRGRSRVFAYDSFRDAMDCYEKAITLRREDDDEAILRWNACVRTIQMAKLEPRQEEGEAPLE